MDNPFVERQPERRSDPMLATLVDVALAYRENLGARVAEAFMRETGVPGPLMQRVLAGAAGQRASLPRRWAPRAVQDLHPQVDGAPVAQHLAAGIALSREAGQAGAAPAQQEIENGIAPDGSRPPA